LELQRVHNNVPQNAPKLSWTETFFPKLRLPRIITDRFANERRLEDQTLDVLPAPLFEPRLVPVPMLKPEPKLKVKAPKSAKEFDKQPKQEQEYENDMDPAFTTMMVPVTPFSRKPNPFDN